MKIGLLGFGAMGRAHAYAIANQPFFYETLPFAAEVAGVCTAHAETATAAAKRYGFPLACTEEDRLILDPAIDVIDICTPNVYHYETLKKAVRAGKHIYCEKPLCVTAAEAEEVATLAEQAGITAQVVFHNRYLAPVRRAKELLAAGRIGKPVSFRACYLHDSCADLGKNAGWKQDREICGGGVLLDLGSHVLDLLYYLLGEYAAVSGKAQIAHPHRKGMHGEPWQTNAEEAFYLIATMQNGAVGTVEASKLAVGANDELSVEIHGEQGALRFDLMDPNWLWFYDGARPGGVFGGERGYQKIECVGRYPAPGGNFPAGKAPADRLRGHVESMHAFLTAAAAAQPASPSFREAAHIQRVMETAYRSSAVGGKELPIS